MTRRRASSSPKDYISSHGGAGSAPGGGETPRIVMLTCGPFSHLSLAQERGEALAELGLFIEVR